MDASGEPGRGYALADQVYERILSRIVDGTHPVNARLPSEAAQADGLGVSRPVLRQALKRLRDDGVIVSRQGSGSYVIERPDRAMLTFAPVGSIADIRRTFEFRAVIEGEAAALAAERRSEPDLTAIAGAMTALEDAIRTGALGSEEDGAFHLAICAATGNHYFPSVLASMQPQVLAGMNLARSLSMTRPAARLTLLQDEHRKILSALEAGDPAAARAAMRGHIENAQNGFVAQIPMGIHLVNPGW